MPISRAGLIQGGSHVLGDDLHTRIDEHAGAIAEDFLNLQLAREQSSPPQREVRRNRRTFLAGAQQENRTVVGSRLVTVMSSEVRSSTC